MSEREDWREGAEYLNYREREAERRRVWNRNLRLAAIREKLEARCDPSPARLPGDAQG